MSPSRGLRGISYLCLRAARSTPSDVCSLRVTAHICSGLRVGSYLPERLREVSYWAPCAGLAMSGRAPPLPGARAMLFAGRRRAKRPGRRGLRLASP